MFNLKYFTILFLLAASMCIAAAATPTEELKTAADSGKSAFLLVTEPGVQGLEGAREKIRKAMTQVEGSVMIEMDRTDAQNETLIKKYRLSGAPLPLILVFAKNGVIAGGKVASTITSQQLVTMVPSPKMGEVLKALQSGKAVFVTAYRDGMSTTSKVAGQCAAACEQLPGKSVSIRVDMADRAEKQFLQQLKVNVNAVEPVTVVINAKGKVSGSYNGLLNVANLVQSATKLASGGCCSSSSGNSCAPQKKEN